MPLDGSAESWWVKIDAKVYGPYSSDQMLRFVAEGRVTPTSLVAPDAHGQWMQARQSTRLARLFSQRPSSFKSEPSEGESTGANLLIYVDLASLAPPTLHAELKAMGAVTEIAPNLFLARTMRTAGAVRNALSPLLARGDKLLVMDATRDRLAWFNLGPETDARIREIWNSHLTK